MSWQLLASEPCELGESPFWHPHEQMLYWVDIAGRKVLRANVFMGSIEHWDMPSEPGCIAPAQQGGLVIALRDGLYRARAWGGELQRIVAAAHDPQTTRFNDGKCDPLGRFWVGTISEPREAAPAELFAFDGRAGGAPTLRRMAGEATVANGLAWSEDGTTLYWADTTAHVIRAWDWEGESNQLSRPRVFQQFPRKPAGWQPGQPGYGGRPDGAAVDAQGNYWVAMYEGRRLLQFAASGTLLVDLPTPVQCPTMPCFGGEDLQTLYLTSARQGRSADELAAMPHSGCVFSMRVEVPGLPVNFYRD